MAMDSKKSTAPTGRQMMAGMTAMAKSMNAAVTTVKPKSKGKGTGTGKRKGC